MKRSHSVRVYVIDLVVAVTLPLLAFGAFLLVRSANNEQQAIVTAAQDRAEGAAADLGRELRHLQDLTSALAMSHYLFLGDQAAFPSSDGPVGLVARDLSGRQLLNTCMANGRTLPASDALRNIAYDKPSISDLVLEPLSGEPILTIDMAIRREDNSEFILSLCALPRILRVLAEQRLPQGWTAMLVDRQGRTIARTTPVGAGTFTSTGSELAATAAIDKGSNADFRGNSGVAYRASSLVDLGDWTVAITVPDEIFFGPVRRSLLVLLVAGSGTVALVLILAVDIGRRIAGPIADLAGVAGALASGRPIAPPLTGVNEADLVAHALRCANEDLSRHTAELTQTVGALRQSEKQLQELSDDLRQALDERTELLNRTVSAQEDERQRIARELHDQIGQYFAAMSIGLNALEKAAQRDSGAHRRIADLKTITSSMGREVYQISCQLRPAALDDLGLEAAMADYLERWSERFQLGVDFVGNLRKKRLSEPIEITLYRVLQEGMTNIVKHAGANKISVVLDADMSEVRLIIEDDGNGFDLKDSGPHESPTSGFGLTGIRERLALVGGSMIIETAPNRGTALFCRIPDS